MDVNSVGSTKAINSNAYQTPRNGLNRQPAVGAGSSSTGSLGSEGLLLHQASASSDSGNSSCVSGSGVGGGTAPDDPETKNDASFGSSASAGEVTGVGLNAGEEDEEEDERQSLLLKKPSKKKGATIYVNKVYDEGIGLGGGTARGSSTETDDREDPEEERDVKPLLVENEKRKPPKSIVKSPSNLSFGAKEAGGVGQRPRLNLQFQQPVETVIDDRPVHHVQFSKQQDNGYCYGPEQDLANGTKVDQAVCGSPVGSILSRASGGSSTSSSGSSSNENSSLGGYAEARPPDGGWGWVVCFASFMVNLIADGVTFSFGVLYVELLSYFGEGKGKTAWVGSLFMAMPLLSGPIASFLTDRYGCRNVTIVGSILASLGFALSAYANTIEMLYLTFGVLAGFGLSLCYVAAVVIVAYYFDKKRSFATGLSVCGSGIGTCIFAKVTQILLDEYGWRGTTLILAGIFLNMCLCGLLMRDLEWTTHKSKLKRKQQKEADSYSVSNSTNTAGTASNLNATDATSGGGPATAGGPQQQGGGDPEAALLDPDDPRLFSSLISFPTFIKNGEKVPFEVLELLYKHRNVHEHVLQNYPNLLHSRSFSEPLAPKSNELSPEKTINPEQREPLDGQHHKRQLNLPPGDDLEQADHPFLRRAHSHRPTTGLRTPTTAYLKDLRMHRHSLTYRGAMLNIQRYRLRASSCPDIYRNSMTTIAKEKTAWYQGIDEFKTLLIALGWMGDCKSINPNTVYAVCMGLCGLVTALVPLFTDYLSLSVLAGAFGLFIAANYSLTSIILVELITLEKFTNAYGLLLLVQGVANLVGPPLAGWISDMTENYNLSFYLAGLFIALSGLLLFVLPAIGKYKKFNQRRTSKQKQQQQQLGGATCCYGMDHLTQLTPGSKPNGTSVLITDCFAQEKLLKEGANV
ncbi:monocarboxylate transporter [Culex quinquefasciatus]|uniref:Monocarboxylate transporter n=1 Tax=Culex quinquefasciatus TaxID=7176 RepID=B0WRR6_CULQU|nr:monocarboxylate transporter [Culex quinquefasciatus]|eukprot:XP_001851400.1 monocarboxylate transporter [Culex quinquefasciatus]